MNREYLTYTPGVTEVFTAHDAITVTTTSGAIDVTGAKGVGIELSSALVATVQNRAGNVTITVSMDGGTTFRAYSMLISNTVNSNAQDLTRVASLALTAGTAQSGIVWMTPETMAGITHIKAVFTRTTEGTAGTFTVNVTVTK